VSATGSGIEDGGQTHDGIYAQLKHDIAAGKLSEGTRLVETQLADRYAVSRTPIRQALLALEQDGLVERDGRSLHVRRQAMSDIIELYEIRELLEERAARLAARRHEESDKLILNHLLDHMEDVPEPDRYAMNREFHTAMWRAAHHAVLMQALERLYVPSVYGLKSTVTGADRWAKTVREHRAMVDAILSGDEDLAARLVAEHLQTAREIRIAASLSGSPT
jgi:DNA-binding GntR family transcriptional regulator